MTEEVKPEVIKKTQDLLGKFVKKPPLTDKLLKKPPFRFLHDIIGTVIRETSFLDGLYTEEELMSENIKDKEDKIKYLQKLINALKIITGSEVSARPSKIVAGHEPTKTNELLQLLGKALQRKLSSSIIVSQIKDGVDFSKEIKTKTSKTSKNGTEKQEKSKTKRDSTPASRKSTDDKPKKKVDEKKQRSDSHNRSVRTEKMERPEKSKSKVKENKVNTNQSPDRKPPKELSKGDKYVAEALKSKIDMEHNPASKEQIFINMSQVNDATNDNIIPDVLAASQNTIDTITNTPYNSITTIDIEKKILEDSIKVKSSGIRRQSEMEVQSGPKSIEKSDSLNTIGKAIDTEVSTLQKPIIDSFKGSIASAAVTGQPQEMSSKLIEPVRPPTVRPRTSLRPPSARPVSARPAAPRVRDRTADIVLPVEQVVPMGKVNVIVENFDKAQDEEDNENLVVVESASIIEELSSIPAINVLENRTAVQGIQGHLVAQILETQKELVEEFPKGSVEIEWDVDGQRSRETKKRNIENIRSKIQTVTRAALPLGQIINFLQEDYDNITRELQMWRSTNTSLNNEIVQLRNLADQNLEPLMKQYQEMNEDIEKQKERNDTLKSEILENHQKINTLLTTII